MSNKRKTTNQEFAAQILLLIFYPFGLMYIFSKQIFSKRTRYILLAIPIVLVLLVIISAFANEVVRYLMTNLVNPFLAGIEG
jgi:hypothetical protein